MKTKSHHQNLAAARAAGNLQLSTLTAFAPGQPHGRRARRADDEVGRPD